MPELLRNDFFGILFSVTQMQKMLVTIMDKGVAQSMPPVLTSQARFGRSC